MISIKKISSIWGLYWLLEQTNWQNPLFNKHSTDIHKCYVYTPTNHYVWYQCDENIGIDFGKPLHQSFWKLLEQIYSEKTEVLRSLSFYPSRILKLLRADQEFALKIIESSGFGYEVSSKTYGLIKARNDKYLSNNFNVESNSSRNLRVYDNFVSLETTDSKDSVLLENEKALVDVINNEETIIIDKNESTIMFENMDTIILKFKQIPSRIGWLQPFILVWDFLEEEDEIDAQYIELYLSNKKYVFMSTNPIRTIFSARKKMLEIHSKNRETIKLLKRDVHDLTTIGEWTTLSSNETYHDVPKIRISPPIFVPFMIRLKKDSTNEWSLTIGLSNPSEISTSFTMFIDKPFFMKEIFINGEKIEDSNYNYLEAFITSKSIMRIDMRIGKKKETITMRSLSTNVFKK